MPALGMAQETGTLVRWLKAAGDAVREGDALAEIQTDKATVELEARASGVLADIRAHEGEEIPVGQVIALILAPGEQPATDASASAATPEPAASGGVSPLARRIAEERGVDPSAIPTNVSRRGATNATTSAPPTYSGSRMSSASPFSRRCGSTIWAAAVTTPARGTSPMSYVTVPLSMRA